jgi:NADPH:quinone reductase-like Zn-dependent oxidoreductase
MKSVRFDHLGDPLEVLSLQEIDESTPGQGQILLRLRARTISISDLYFIRGHYGLKPKPPCTPGFEGLGTVEVIGPGVTDLEVGDRVVVLEPAQVGAPGTWQESCVTKASEVYKVSDGLSDTAAAQMICNPTSAWVIATSELALKPDQHLLITAGASNFSHVLMKMAHLRGAKCIHLVRNQSRVTEVQSYGADHVICTANEDFVERVMSITGGQGVDAIVDTVSGKVAADALRTLKPRGTMLVFGLLSGLNSNLDFGQILFKTLNVRGFWLASWLKHTPYEERKKALAELDAALQEHPELLPAIEAEYELGDFKEAIRHADRFGRQGKVMLFG